jgi:hypothetical protein
MAGQKERQGFLRLLRFSNECISLPFDCARAAGPDGPKGAAEYVHLTESIGNAVAPGELVTYQTIPRSSQYLIDCIVTDGISRPPHDSHSWLQLLHLPVGGNVVHERPAERKKAEWNLDWR